MEPIEFSDVQVGMKIRAEDDRRAFEDVVTDVGVDGGIETEWFTFYPDEDWSLSLLSPPPPPVPEWAEGQYAEITLKGRGQPIDARFEGELWYPTGYGSADGYAPREVSSVRPLRLVDQDAIVLPAEALGTYDAPGLRRLAHNLSDAGYTPKVIDFILGVADAVEAAKL